MLTGWKTYIVAAIIAITGFLSTVDWATFLANPKDGWALVVSGLVMAIMRSITTTPPAVGAK